MRLYSAKETYDFKEPTNQKLQPAAPAPKELCLYTVLCSVLQRVAVCCSVWVGGGGCGCILRRRNSRSYSQQPLGGFD